MDLNDLSATLAVLLSVSLSTERLVAIVKTAFPRWFADTAAPPEDPRDPGAPKAERRRRLRVQLLAFMAAWLTAGLLANAGQAPPFSLPAYARHLVGNVFVGSMQMPTVVVAFLATGGSAFWAQVVGYLTNARRLAATRVAAASLAHREQALRGGAV